MVSRFILLYEFVIAGCNQIMYILVKSEVKACLKSAVKILNVKQVSFVLQSCAGLILSLGRFHFHSTSLRFLSNFIKEDVSTLELLFLAAVIKNIVDTTSL